MKTSPHQLLAFAQVMREGSFSAAARRLSVTQSALSQHIKKLEERVGARLISRGAGGLELTNAGAELFDLAERYAALTSEIDERLLGYSNFDTGHLNIIANAPQPALSAISRYSKVFPKVELSFALYDWTRTMAMLSKHIVDIAFITDPRKTADCVYKKLSETKYVLYVPKGHHLASHTVVSLTDIKNETLILPEEGSLTKKVVTATMSRQNLELRGRLNTTTFPVMKEAILHGAGVGIFLADAAAPFDDLAQVEIQEIPQTFEIYAAVPKHKFGLRLVQSFWDELHVEEVT